MSGKGVIGIAVLAVLVPVTVLQLAMSHKDNQFPLPPPDIPALMQQADAMRGQQLMRPCLVCHKMVQGKGHKMGPNLFGVAGSEIGSAKDFRYSEAMQEMEGVWTTEKLFMFLHKPRTVVPGTRMAFSGIRDYQDVADMVKYLQGITSSSPGS